MPASTCEISPINLHLPGASAVMSGIPVELPTSPCSLDVDHEHLTVWPHFTTFSPWANLLLLESEPFITLMTVNRSPYVRSRCARPRRRSVYLTSVLVRNC